MRITYFSDNLYPEISGISDSILTTGQELRRRGHEILYVGPWYPPRAYKKSGDGARDQLPVLRLPSLYFPNSPTGQSRIVVPFGYSIPAMRRFKPDIIHSQSPHGAGLEALFASWYLGVPLVGTEHTPIEEFTAYSPAAAATVGAQWLRWERWYYNRCAFVTTPYQGLFDDMHARGLRAKGRGQANPVPFVPKPASEAQRVACKKALNIPGPLVLCSGRLAPEKHVDEVIQAFAQLIFHAPDATMVITGHGSAESALKSLAERLGVAPRVRFVGFVSPQELEQLYCAAEAYIIMSTAETQSLSLMQAYAAGVPAVAVRSRGLANYTPPQCGYLVEPGDTTDAAQKLLLLIKDAAVRERMGAAGAEYVKQFAPATIAAQWEEIYKSVIK